MEETRQFAKLIELPAGSEHVRFDSIAQRMAHALWPGAVRDQSDELSLDDWARGAARINLDTELASAVKAGRLAVLDPLTRGPHPLPIGNALNGALVALPELARFVSERGIGIRSIPVFVTEVRPLTVPPELLALENSAELIYEEHFGIQRGSGRGACKAIYLAEIQARIARQAEDFFTVNEAAQILADSRTGPTGAQWVRDMYEAHRAGALAIRECASRKPMRPRYPVRAEDIDKHWTAVQEMSRHCSDLVTGADVGAWLDLTGAGYGFPAPLLAALPSVGPVGGDALPLQRFPAQEAAILRHLQGMGHKATALPRNPPGKPGVKAEAKSALVSSQLFVGEKVFDKAWERLRATGEIRDRL
jgi:hypothetical protein